MTISQAVHRDLVRLLGDGGALHTAQDMSPFEHGYRYGTGHALAIARPATTEQLQAVVRYCFAQDLKLMAQGANTGLVGASTPDASGGQVVVNLDRLGGVEALDPIDRMAQVLAGTRLSALNSAASAHGLIFPIDLGADPSLGGMVATNTGGSRLLRYGDVQRNLSGLEVVLIDGNATVLRDMKGLRKDNSGLDLKQVFVGTSGSFGIIARAQIELHRLPAQSACALVVPSEHAAIPALFTHLDARAGEFLSAFEGMSANALRAAFAHNPRLRNPFGDDRFPPYVVLVELSCALPSQRLELADLLADLLGQALEQTPSLIVDASMGRAGDYWAIRHSISDGLRTLGAVIGFDIAVARSRLPSLRANLIEVLARECPMLQVCDFGHCGDGGDHFNLVWPHESGIKDESVIEHARQLVYQTVTQEFDGSFSAEHGIGPHNVAYYRRYASRVERHMASHLKQFCDPKGLLGRAEFG